MSTLRMRNLAILSIEQQLTDKIFFYDGIEEFANKKKKKKSNFVESCNFYFRNKDSPNFFFYHPPSHFYFLTVNWWSLSIFGVYLKYTIFQYVKVIFILKIQKCGTWSNGETGEGWSSIRLILNLASHNYWPKHTYIK